MKLYTLKLAMTFLISYALLVVIGVFSYTHISQTFIIQQAKENILLSGETVSQRINAQINLDYNTLEALIDGYVLLGLNPIEELTNKIDEIEILGQNFSGFGTIDNSSLTINSETLVYVDSFIAQDYEQPVAIYTFKQAFYADDQTPYIFFRIGEYIAYFEASQYLTYLASFAVLDSEFLVMSSENTIVYHSIENLNATFLYDELRAGGASEDVIDGLKLSIANNESSVVQATFLGENSFITFNPLDYGFSANNYYLVIIYNQEVVFMSVEYLSNILFGVFLGVFVLFAVAMIVLFKILQNKLDDIEDARLRHYYAKPFIIRISSKGRIKAYNKSFKKLLGEYDNYNNVQDFSIKKDLDYDSIEGLIHRQVSFTVLFDLGVSKIIYVRFLPIRTSGGYLLIGYDATNTEGRFDEYRDLALFNGVTRLPNKNSITLDLDKLFGNATQLSKNNSMVAFNIVSFNKIVILLSEKSKERLLVLMSELTKKTLDGYPATLYDFSQGTFVVLFKDVESYKWIDIWISKLLIIFEQPLSFENIFTEIELKLGVFHIDADRYELLNTEVVIKNTLLALRHANQSVAREYFVYDLSLSAVASREEMMEIDLAKGIINNEFKMVLQPQYNNEIEKIVGFEALIRWTNPKYASESPLKFIQMAEKNNMIIDIGKIAFHETFQMAKELEQYDVHISINISPVQILQSGFVTDVIEIFEQYELKKHSISLEITETFLIDSFELVISKLRLLQKYGFDIHLDDFGTGYSSLQYLSDLPINTIKIDRAFIINLTTDKHSRAIVTMISTLAKTIGLDVIAEGIETDKQNELVYKSGCDVIQGYLIGPAVSKNEAIKLIKEYNIDKSKTVTVKKTSKRREIKR